MFNQIRRAALLAVLSLGIGLGTVKPAGAQANSNNNYYQQQQQQQQQWQRQQDQQRQQQQDQQRQQQQQIERQRIQEQQRQQLQAQQRQQMQDQQRQQLQSQQRQQLQDQQRQQLQTQQRQQVQQQQQNQQKQQMQAQQQTQQRQQQQQLQQNQQRQTQQQQARAQGTLQQGSNKPSGMVVAGGIAKMNRPLTPGEISRGFTGKVTSDGKALIKFQNRVFTVPASRVSGLSARLAAQQNQKAQATLWTAPQQSAVNQRVKALATANDNNRPSFSTQQKRALDSSIAARTAQTAAAGGGRGGGNHPPTAANDNMLGAVQSRIAGAKIAKNQTNQAASDAIPLNNSTGNGTTGDVKKIAPKYVFDARASRYREGSTGKFASATNLPWPDKAGFINSETKTIQAGTVLDRYGSETGAYLGEPGASISERGLPAGSEGLPYAKYRVIKPLSAEVGPAAPVTDFGAVGGSIQYRTDRSIDSLVKSGYLEKLKK